MVEAGNLFSCVAVNLMPTRLIDLHVDWLLQYAPDSSVFDSQFYSEVPGRLAQTAGYLQTTRAAILSCYREAAEWSSRPDPWGALVELIARIEAEFAGRLLIGPDDFDRWEDDPTGFTWGLIGVEGFDPLIRSPADLARLPALFERGVRLFQPVYTAASALGGSSAPGDDRALTALGRDFLAALLDAVPATPGPRLLLDLAHLNRPSTGDVLDWFEADPTRADRLLPIYSHGTPEHAGYATPRALAVDHLRRLRALGGFVGISLSPPFFAAPEQIEATIEAVAAIPWRGEPGYAGIGIGTDFLGVDRTLPQLGNAEQVVDWVEARFPKPISRALLHDNAHHWIARVTGAAPQIG